MSARPSTSSRPRSSRRLMPRRRRLQIGAADINSRPSASTSLCPGSRPIGAKHPVLQTMNEIVSVFVNWDTRRRMVPKSRATTTIRGAELPAEPSRARYAGHVVHSGEAGPPRSPAAAHAHFARADSLHGELTSGAIVIPGKVHRNDADATHSPVFHQVEGLAWTPTSPSAISRARSTTP